MLFVEIASKHYYVTNEIIKRWYLFNVLLMLVDYVFFYIKNSIFLSLFCRFYIDFIGLSKKCWGQHFLKKWLRNVTLVNFLKIRSLLFKTWDNNENQCFLYSSIVFVAIEILQYEQKPGEAKMCGITLHWYFSKCF